MAELSRVLIAGAGVGGLALAQGLARDGIDVAVFERDIQSASRLQGYRLSLTPDGLSALKSLLPLKRWEEVRAACTAPLPGIGFLSQRLETRFFKKTPEPEGEVERYSSISRITLREILLRGLGDRVSFGRTCTGFDINEDGRVSLLIESGEPETGDLLVGADGVRSAVRAQLLPVDNRYDTGVSAIAGKVISDGAQLEALIAPPIGESTVVIGDAPQGLFIANHQLAAEQQGDSYLFWSFLTAHERFPTDVDEALPGRLLSIVGEMTEGWDLRLKHLVQSADPNSVLLLRYASSRSPEPWNRVPVTLIGDAVHNMPPTGGEGANMALKDAATLRSVLRSKGDLDEALDDYETQMREYAFNAVATSMSNLERMVKPRAG